MNTRTTKRLIDLKPGDKVRVMEMTSMSLSQSGLRECKSWIGGEVRKREFVGVGQIEVHFKKGTELYGEHLPACRNYPASYHPRRTHTGAAYDEWEVY